MNHNCILFVRFLKKSKLRICDINALPVPWVRLLS